MAVVQPSLVKLDGGGMLVTWGPMVNGDTGAPVHLPEYGDRSVQLFGTLGVGGICQMQGSNELPTATPATYWQLTDPGLTAIALGSIGAGETVLDPCVHIRPAVTAGDGSTSLTLRMFARRIY